MHPLLPLCVFSLLPVALMLKDSPLNLVPRRSVPYHSDNALLFREEGVSNYSTMLLREDLGLLILGAQEAVFALDLNNISNKRDSVKWEVTEQQVKECENKGKNPKTECKNYIRILHTMTDGRMYVCGTNAFDPECRFLSFANGELTLEKTGEDGKGKCPFDPFQRCASIMVDNDLYSATSMNFLGSEPILARSSPSSIRTEFKSSWLNEPSFVSMALMPESQQSKDGDDDKVYIFFSETSVECDCYDKLVVPRVARVCKGDQGGQRTLQKKWTSFLKTRINCPVLDSQLPYVIQDSFRWCDFKQNWKECIFFAVFTPQSDTSDLSAVCAYNMSDISSVFSEGKYKTPVTVETSFVKWVMYSGEVPVPRPGACVKDSLVLPDRTLQFIRDKPLMDQAVEPIGGKPFLIQRGATFTRIIVNQVQGADGKMHHVMFIATEAGTMIKAVNYNGEMFIVEEVEIFPSPHPIKVLTFSNVTGQLYAGSDFGAAQIPPAACERSSSCVDCVLARDPYCGWDTAAAKCVSVSSSQRELIQSVTEGDASLCPEADRVKPVNLSIWLGGKLELSCPSPSNLATVQWEQDNRVLTSSARQQVLPNGLLIFNASVSDAGHYRCSFTERSKASNFNTVVAHYQVSVDPSGSGRDGRTLQPQTDGPSVAGLQAAVAFLVIALVALLGWNFCKGHLPLPWNCIKTSSDSTQRAGDQDDERSAVSHQEAQRPAAAECKPASRAQNSSSNNNHADGRGALNVDQTSVHLMSSDMT